MRRGRSWRRSARVRTPPPSPPAPQPEQPFPRIATLGWSLDPTATEHEAESVSTDARTEDSAPPRADRDHDRGGRPADHRILRVRGTLRRRALVRPARI